jgi:O-methyltransferase
MKILLKKTALKLGIEVERRRAAHDALHDLTPGEKQIIASASPFTMTSADRMAALVNAVNYLCKNDLPGDIAECGVWRGGSMLIVASMLLAHGDKSRNLYLYDTFDGMPPPTEHDIDFEGKTAANLLAAERPGAGIWCHAGLEEVRANLLGTGYPPEKIHFIKGKVEDTIPATLPPALCLLRLDTDWYASTLHELVHMYPSVCIGGILMVDDYGHWGGAKKAVDEYFAGQRVYFHRVDYTARVLVKSGPP